MPYKSQWQEVVSNDDDESVYEYLHYPPPQQKSKIYIDQNGHKFRIPSPEPSKYKVHQPAEDNITIKNFLGVPQQARQRSSSTGAQPQPNVVFVQQPASRSPSRERRRHHDSSSDEDDYRGRKHRGKSPYRGGNVDLAIKMAKLELMEEKQQRHSMDPILAEKIARLEQLEKRKESELEEAALLARIEDRKRKEKLAIEANILEYKERLRKESEAEEAAILAAEQKRLRREAELKAETERLTMLAKTKAEKEKAETARIIAEAKAKAEQDREKAKEERRQILLEEKLREEKEKKEREELRKKILAEEEERIAKEKAKKKKEEDEFQQKVKERFMKAGKKCPFCNCSPHTDRCSGYSPDYIEDILDSKRKSLDRRHSQHGANKLAVDIARPTYIRVKLEHLYPETLERYNLPWSYDPIDKKYVLIKEYISHELQQELFEHTRLIKIKRERLLIDGGRKEEIITTLTPGGQDDMYLVKKKIKRTPSKGRSPGRGWMFT